MRVDRYRARSMRIIRTPGGYGDVQVASKSASTFIIGLSQLRLDLVARGV